MQHAYALMHEAAVIREASEKDIGTIGALTHRIWPICFAGVLTAPQIGNMLARIYSPENLATEMQSGHRFWIVSEHTEPVGYASAYKEGDIIWLKKLYLLAAARGKGLGRQLTETAAAAFTPAKEIRLLVNKENLSAHDFYLRTGFKRIGEKQVMMGDHAFVDYIYSKPL